MTIIYTENELKDFYKNASVNTKNIGFVPTMGALHDGHISLINQSTSKNQITVCSIFVNPTQFNNLQDFEKYPITIDADITLLKSAKCDVLFLPNVAEMYPEGMEESKKEVFNVDGLDTILEGKFRPGHYQGVCNIVYRLLKKVGPANLYMGIKDYQQCMVIKKLIVNKNLPIQLHICPTLRDIDGLAQSSRNARLSLESRKNANAIFQCLQYINQNKQKESSATQKKYCENLLISNGFTPEYFILANAKTLKTLDNYTNNEPMVVLVAAWLDGIRLIDNFVLS